MMISYVLPGPLARSAWASRMRYAVDAVRSVGPALVALRGQVEGIETAAKQLKTSADLAAEGWVLGFLEHHCGDDVFLSEERYDRGAPWSAPAAYWTIDALDGTRSYVDGFDGFCVQVAYVVDGRPRMGVIGEPTTGAIYAGAERCGAWRVRDGAHVALRGPRIDASGGLRFIDSTHPSGLVADLLARAGNEFVECGSVGLKICRIAEGEADVFIKQFDYRIWDVAPGDVLLRELGIELRTWAGTSIDYASGQVVHHGLVAASSGIAADLLDQIRAFAG